MLLGLVAIEKCNIFEEHLFEINSFEIESAFGLNEYE